jgi:hypothetical protein
LVALIIRMFKKNPNRPAMAVQLKRVQGGYRVVANEGHALFQVKRIIRTMYRRSPLLTQPTSCPRAPDSAWSRTG